MIMKLLTMLLQIIEYIQTTECTFNQGTIYAQEFGGGSYRVTEEINGIRIGQETSVNSFTSGTARLFGIKEL